MEGEDPPSPRYVTKTELELFKRIVHVYEQMGEVLSSPKYASLDIPLTTDLDPKIFRSVGDRFRALGCGGTYSSGFTNCKRRDLNAIIDQGDRAYNRAIKRLLILIQEAGVDESNKYYEVYMRELTLYRELMKQLQSLHNTMPHEPKLRALEAAQLAHSQAIRGRAMSPKMVWAESGKGDGKKFVFGRGKKRRSSSRRRHRKRRSSSRRRKYHRRGSSFGRKRKQFVF